MFITSIMILAGIILALLVWLGFVMFSLIVRRFGGHNWSGFAKKIISFGLFRLFILSIMVVIFTSIIFVGIFKVIEAVR